MLHMQYLRPKYCYNERSATAEFGKTNCCSVVQADNAGCSDTARGAVTGPHRGNHTYQCSWGWRTPHLQLQGLHHSPLGLAQNDPRIAVGAPLRSRAFPHNSLLYVQHSLILTIANRCILVLPTAYLAQFWSDAKSECGRF